MGCLSCMRRFSQVILIICNILVLLLGFGVMVVGVWAKVNDRVYFEIADDKSDLTGITVLLIIVGVFVMVLGAVGTVGAVFASFVFGRIILGLYAIVLGILVICEIAGGIAAAVRSDSLENVFRDSANSTFSRYPTDPSVNGSYNSFQRSFHCCGVDSYHDYARINVTIPDSCCRKNVSIDQCATAREDPINSTALWDKGCVDTAVDDLRENLGAVAGVAITLGIVQIIGIVMACFVAIYQHEDNKYEVV